MTIPKKNRKQATGTYIFIGIWITVLVMLALYFIGVDNNAHAQNPTVNTPVLVDTVATGTDDNLLSIPRYKGLWSNGDTLYLFHRESGADPAWYYSINAGASWVAILGNFEDDATFDYHSSFWLANASATNKGIFGTATDGLPYVKRIRLDATHHGMVIGDTVSRVNLTTVASTWYTNVVAPDTQNVWIFYRIGGSYEGFKYKHTTNGFTTVDSGIVWGVNLLGSQIRVGGLLDASSVPCVVMLATFGASDDRNGFYYSKWNGSAFDAPNDSAIITKLSYGENLHANNDRAFSIAMVDGKIHLLFGHEYNLLHVYQNGSGTWICDTPSTSIETWRVQWYPIISARGKALNLVYRVLQTADTVYQNLCYKRWTLSGGWDADSTIIVKDTRVKYSQMPPSMPDSLNWLPVWWDNYITHEMFYARIDFDTLPPPTATVIANVIDVGEDTAALECVYTGMVGIDSIYLFCADGGIDTTIRVADLVSPDTIVATGLSSGTYYLAAFKIIDNNGSHMSVYVEFTTDVPTAQQIRYRVRTRR